MFAIGEAFGALGAYIDGIVSGDEALVDVAVDGMRENRQRNVDTVIVLGTMGRGKGAPRTNQRNSRDKEALVDMAKMDKRKGITPADMKAYKDLNRGLPDPFPTNQVRGPEAHGSGGAHSRQPHGHVGPVHHIPIVVP
jgi:hypothetical protein